MRSYADVPGAFKGWCTSCRRLTWVVKTDEGDALCWGCSAPPGDVPVPIDILVPEGAADAS